MTYEHPQIDEAVLTATETSWNKVAMIIIKAADKLGSKNDETYNAIASRIEALVLDGQLEARGNIKNWRFSEVRRPIRTPPNHQ